MANDNNSVLTPKQWFSQNLRLTLRELWDSITAVFATKQQVISDLATKADMGHNHDTRYYQKEATYTRAEVNNLITTPRQQYVTVAQYSELPATGSSDTIYRVANWDGSNVVTTSYCEYAWGGSDYILLDVKGPQGTPMRSLTAETATIAPNVLNRWTVPVESLTLTLSTGASGFENEYKLEFTVDGDDFNLSLGGASVRWVEEPTWGDGYTYQVTIINGLAICTEWEAEVV